VAQRVAQRIGLKICGITRAEDLRACVELSVDAVGLNLWPGSKRYIDMIEAAELLDAVGDTGELLRVGVFVEHDLDAIARAIATLDLDLIQLHGDGPLEPAAELAARYEVGWIQVIRGTPALESLQLVTPAPTWILLDAAVPGYGGAGQTTDWTWAAAAVEALAPTPVWLAGGIDPGNVGEALRRVGPAGLDVASGAELPGARRGEKDRGRIATLLEAIAAATRIVAKLRAETTGS
jgi:phosphoribosylanthranilate isomerase